MHEFDVGPRLWSDAVCWMEKWYNRKVTLEQLSDAIYNKKLLQIVPKGCQADSENTHTLRLDGPTQRICEYYSGA